MCIEITITGILKGLGRTYIPSFISIALNLARIPMAIVLSKPDILGINGIWSVSYTHLDVYKRQGYNFHGYYEYAVAEEMEKAKEVIINIVKNNK